MRISDWSSDVCSSDLSGSFRSNPFCLETPSDRQRRRVDMAVGTELARIAQAEGGAVVPGRADPGIHQARVTRQRSEEHTSELQSLMRISYAVFCLKKKKTRNINKT